MRLYPSHQDKLPASIAVKYENEAGRYWDGFYRRNADRFFKDRHYFHKEFPQLLEGNLNILEVGCGVGNSVFPLLDLNPEATVYACDFSPTAVNLVKAHPQYSQGRCHAFVADITKDPLVQQVPAGGVHYCTMVFVLSAVAPAHMPQALANIAATLVPGSGRVLFRDYAEGDLAQLRLEGQGAKLISRGFYARGDGTCCYYFDEEGLVQLFAAAGFQAEQVVVHDRVIENRKLSNAMQRRWIQGVFRYCGAPGAAAGEGGGDGSGTAVVSGSGSAGQGVAGADEAGREVGPHHHHHHQQQQQQQQHAKPSSHQLPGRQTMSPAATAAAGAHEAAGAPTQCFSRCQLAGYTWSLPDDLASAMGSCPALAAAQQLVALGASLLQAVVLLLPCGTAEAAAVASTLGGRLMAGPALPEQQPSAAEAAATAAAGQHAGQHQTPASAGAASANGTADDTEEHEAGDGYVQGAAAGLVAIAAVRAGCRRAVAVWQEPGYASGFLEVLHANEAAVVCERVRRVWATTELTQQRQVQRLRQVCGVGGSDTTVYVVPCGQ